MCSVAERPVTEWEATVLVFCVTTDLQLKCSQSTQARATLDVAATTIAIRASLNPPGKTGKSIPISWPVAGLEVSLSQLAASTVASTIWPHLDRLRTQSWHFESCRRLLQTRPGCCMKIVELPSSPAGGLQAGRQIQEPFTITN